MVLERHSTPPQAFIVLGKVLVQHAKTLRRDLEFLYTEKIVEFFVALEQHIAPRDAQRALPDQVLSYRVARQARGGADLQLVLPLEVLL